MVADVIVPVDPYLPVAVRSFLGPASALWGHCQNTLSS